MSFSVFMSSATGAPGFTFANSTYTFNVNLRDMIPPERLNKKYRMRLAANSEGIAGIDDLAPYHATIELTNAIINTQFNGSLSPYFWLNIGSAVAGGRFVVRPYDNPPVIVQSLGEVYTIKIKIIRNFSYVMPLIQLHFVLSFEPVD